MVGVKINMIYQFKIVLKDSNPSIWRIIQVPQSFSFWEFHSAILDSMGWKNCHLYEFEVQDPKTSNTVRIGIPDESFGNSKVLYGGKTNLSSYFSLENSSAEYIYDFGDYWVHELTLEKIISANGDVVYPQCIAGECACPPEDCGGVGGYEAVLERLADPRHKEHEFFMEFYGGLIDVKAFDPKEVIFEDPKIRL